MGKYVNYKFVLCDLVNRFYHTQTVDCMCIECFNNYSFLCNNLLRDLRHTFIMGSIDYCITDRDCSLGFIPKSILVNYLSDYIDKLENGYYAGGFCSYAKYIDLAHLVSGTIVDYQSYLVKEL